MGQRKRLIHLCHYLRAATICADGLNDRALWNVLNNHFELNEKRLTRKERAELDQMTHDLPNL